MLKKRIFFALKNKKQIAYMNYSYVLFATFPKLLFFYFRTHIKRLSLVVFLFVCGIIVKNTKNIFG